MSNVRRALPRHISAQLRALAICLAIVPLVFSLSGCDNAGPGNVTEASSASEASGTAETSNPENTSDATGTPETHTESGSGESDTTDTAALSITAEGEALILEYLRQKDSGMGGDRVYSADTAPSEPSEYDYRVEKIAYAGEHPLHEGVGVAYIIESSHYYLRQNGSGENIYKWIPEDPYYIVLIQNAQNGTFVKVAGLTYNIPPDKKIEDVIIEVTTGLRDIEVSLSLDGHPDLVGIGSTPALLNEAFETEVLEGGPIYADGDKWLRYTYPKLSVVCYYTAAKDRDTVYALETTRTDVETHRGIRIGAPRSKVLSVYPDAYDTPYWELEGDYVWYSSNAEGWGETLIFYFKNDSLTQLDMKFMFD